MSNRTLDDIILGFLGGIEADFGYAVGNLNMDTTPESRTEIVTALRHFLLKNRIETLEMVKTTLSFEGIKLSKKQSESIQEWINQLEAQLDNIAKEIRGEHVSK